jgi:hypothetical protein
MRLLWRLPMALRRPIRHERVLSVERRPPRVTANGKILHLVPDDRPVAVDQALA